MRVFLGDSSVEIIKCFILYLRRRTCVFVLFRVLVGARCRGAASEKSVLACVVLAGTSEGLVGFKVLV